MSGGAVVSPAATLAGKQPWLGLASYRESDSELFFGREKEGLELLRRARREVLTVLFGPSGTGKTSLLNASLFPGLRQSGFLPVAIRLDHTGARPDYAGQVRALLARGLSSDAEHPVEEQALAPPQASAERETLWEYLHRVVFWDWRNNPVTPVLVFDQFEECFTLGRSTAAMEEFLTELADLVENYIPRSVRARMAGGDGTIAFPHQEQRCKVILSLREDFVSHLDGLRRGMPSVMHNRFAIARMNGEQALTAVREPGRGIVEEGVARQIVSFVAAANEGREAAGEEGGRLEHLRVDPALLSVVCRELNNRRIADARPLITDDLLQEAGTDILNDFYERCYAGLNAAVRVFVEDRLLTASGYRSTVPLEEATQAGIAGGDVATLVDRRLIRTEERLGIPHLELTHDLLTKVVQRSRAERQERDQREAEKRKRLEWENRRREELRRTRRLLFIMSGAALVCLAMGILAFGSYRRAEAARRLAESEKREADEAKTKAVTALDVLTKAQKETDRQRILGTWQSAARQAARDAGDHTDDDRSALLAHEALIFHERTPEQPQYLIEDALQRVLSLGPFSHVLRGHESDVNTVAFGPDGHHLASGGSDKTVRIWDLRRPDTGPQILTRGQARVYAVAFSPDGSHLAAGGDDRRVRIWDLRRPQAAPQAFTHSNFVYTVAFAPDGTRLASGSADLSLSVWNLREPSTPPLVLRGLQSPVLSVAFAPDGNRVAVGVDNWKAAVWDLRQPNAPPQSLLHRGPVRSVAFSPDGSHLATACDDKLIYVWDLRQPQAPPMLLSGHVAEVESVAFAPDGNHLASGGKDMTVRVWDLTQPKAAAQVFSGHQKAVTAVAYSRDGRRIASASSDTTVRVWELAPAPAPRVLPSPPGEVRSVALGQGGNRLGSASGVVRVWDLGAQKVSQRVLTEVGNFVSVAMSPDGERVAALDGDGPLRLWNLRQGKGAPVVVSSERSLSTAVAFSPDGNRLAQAGYMLRVWDLSRPHTEATVLSALRVKFEAVAFAPDGNRVASGDGLTVRVWDLHHPNVATHVLTGHQYIVSSVAFAPDGRHLASGSWDTTVRVWDLDRPEAAPVIFAGHQDSVTSVAFAPDGKSLASGGRDAAIRLWPLWTAAAEYLCQRAWRNLSMEEWRNYIGEGVPYERTCPNLPPGAGAPGGPK